MPKTLRKARALRGTINLINTLVFGVAFGGVALSLFFFSPGRYMSIRIAVLSASCAILLMTSGSLSKRKRRAARWPLMALMFAGALFALWGGIGVVKSLFTAQDISVVVSGAQFILFGFTSLLTAAFARR